MNMAALMERHSENVINDVSTNMTAPMGWHSKNVINQVATDNYWMQEHNGENEHFPQQKQRQEREASRENVINQDPRGHQINGPVEVPTNLSTTSQRHNIHQGYDGTNASTQGSGQCIMTQSAPS